MPNNLKLSNNVVNPQADALSDLADNGYLRIYDGTQPATADTATKYWLKAIKPSFGERGSNITPNDGLIAFNQYFVAGYRDQDTDTLYLIDENKVLWKFDDDSAQPLSYTWKSKRLSLDAPHCFTAARVLADSYTNITINIYADNTLYHTQTVTNKQPFRLPRNGRYRVWQIEVIGVDAIREVAISETVTELQV